MKSFSKFFAATIILVASISFIINAKIPLKADVSQESATGQMNLFIHPQQNVFNANISSYIQEETGLSIKNNFRKLNESTDELGITHVRYQQILNQFPVEGALITTHSKNGKIFLVTGLCYPQLKCLTQIKYSQFHALDVARDEILSFSENNNHDVILNGLTIIPVSGTGELCYSVKVSSEVSKNNQVIFVNASQGEIVRTKSLTRHFDIPLDISTKYSGQRTIIIDSTEFNFTLQEAGRNIKTMSFQWDDDTNNAVNCVAQYKGSFASDEKSEIHFNAEACYDYFLQKFGIHSFDDAYAQIRNYYHSGEYEAGYWNGEAFIFGDGYYDRWYNYPPLTSLSTYAHEYTHAVLQNSVDFSDTGEPAMLDEAIADMFAVAIDFHQNPSYANYLLGEEYDNSGHENSYDIKRDISDPGYNSQPFSYHGAGTASSSILTYWFYLLSEGRTGTNDLGIHYSVQPVGTDTAIKIVYRAFTNYLTSNSGFIDFKNATVQAAKDLYGNCSDEVKQVENAWYATGMGNPSMVTAGYFSTALSNCSSRLVRFTNSSANATSYSWNFGDGNTSTQPSPVHQYNVSGNYPVTLTVTGSSGSGCPSSDTVTQIIVAGQSNAVIPSCIPVANRSVSVGIKSFDISGVSFSTGIVSETYRDFFCEQYPTLIYGDTYTLSLTGENLHYKVWIDFSNDGNFDSTELVLSSRGVTSRIDSIRIPATANMTSPVRMRVICDSLPVINACNDPYKGMVRDYSVKISANYFIPQADFTADNWYISPGDSIRFTDVSLHSPAHWSWSFQNGYPASSTSETPVVSYFVPGAHDVTLTVSNGNGSVTISKTVYVEVNYVFCNVDTGKTMTGCISDIASPPTNAWNNCSFLIAPECAEEITLTFTLLDIYCHVSTHWDDYDYIYVHDGDNANAPLILESSCANIPDPVTAFSGKMFIRLAGYTSENRFTAHWTTIPYPTPAPDSKFHISDTLPPVSTDIQFTDSSETGAYAWWWNFGDGTHSQEVNPVHSYSTSGDYLVTLITSQCNGIDTVIKTVHVQENPSVMISDTAFSQSLSCRDSSIKQIKLKNTGNGDLTFSFPDILSFPSWIEVIPASGVVHPDDSVFLSLKFNSSAIQSGSYTLEKFLHTNDPATSLQAIQFNLQTSGNEFAVLSDTCLFFNSVIQYTNFTDILSVYNSGCDTLFINSISFSNPAFTYLSSSSFILPDSTAILQIKISPTVVGQVNETLTLNLSSGSKTVCLTGSVLPAPVISTVNQINVTADPCSNIISGSIYIRNTGGTDLRINSHSIYDSASPSARVLLLKDSANLSQYYSNLKSALLANQYPVVLTELTQFTPAALSSQLINKDIFIVPFTCMNNQLFSNVSAELLQFVNDGGTVIFLNSTETCGDHIISSGLFHGMPAQNTGTAPFIVKPNHRIVQNVYASNSANSSFYPMNFTDNDLIPVWKSGNQQFADLICYRNQGKGKVIYLGISTATSYIQKSLLNNTISYSIKEGYWFSADTISTMPVAPGDSVRVNYQVDVNELSSGTYVRQMHVFSTDPQQQVITIPVTLNVTSKPCAEFYYNTDSCNGIISFKDKSLNQPVSWQWDFGDGNYSSLQNPKHVYNSGGIYNVELIVCNGTTCDSSVKQIFAPGIGVPVAACIPDTSVIHWGNGIERISFNTINITGNNFRYSDFTCNKSTILSLGHRYCLSMDRGNNYSVFSAWIDYNSDGDFSSTEEVAMMTNYYSRKQAISVLIPTVAPTYAPLRMRVCKWDATYITPTNRPDPCGIIRGDYYRDFTVYLVPDSVNIISQFSYSILDSCKGIVQFFNHSQNASSYRWDFGDGTFSTSVNPIHDFDSSAFWPGQYDVTLTSFSYADSNMSAKMIDLNIMLEKVNLQASGPVVLCPGRSVMLYVPSSFTNLTNVSWLYNDVTQFNADQMNILTDSAGSYRVIYGNYQGCTDTSEAITVTRAPGFVLQASSLEACAGDSIRLSGPPLMQSYQWSTGETTPSVYVNNSGVYTLQLMVSPSCFASDSIGVLFHVPDQPQIVYSNDTLYAPSGLSSYQWYFNGSPVTGYISSEVRPVVTGPYSVMVTDLSGCEAMSDTVFYFYTNITKANKLNVGVYPNPAGDKLNVRLINNDVQDIVLKIVSLPGNSALLIKKEEFQKGSNLTSLDVSSLSPGVYFLIAESKDGISRIPVVIAR